LGDGPPACPHDVGLTDVAYKLTDRSRRESCSMCIDDDGVPDQSGDVVIGSGALILLFCLDETLLGRVDLGIGFHLRHTYVSVT
jgi:hypothetical protein